MNQYEHKLETFDVEAEAVEYMNEQSQNGWEVVNVYHRYYQTCVVMRRMLPGTNKPIHAKG